MMSNSLPNRRVVLVVDDELMIRMMAVDFLVDDGFETLEAANGREALTMLDQHPEICLMITDINMPGEPDGLRLACEARARWRDLRIVVTSGRITPNPQEMPAGGRFLPKPYTGLQLIEAVTLS